MDENLKVLYLQPGLTTDALDAVAHDFIIANGAYPSPLLYFGYPKSICTSVNNIACHGIPDSRPLCVGELITIDVTVRNSDGFGQPAFHFLALPLVP